MATKYRSWCHYVCWAIGSDRPQRDICQIFFDYIARNPKFWRHYADDVRMKYLYLVNKGKVTRIPFSTLLLLADKYAANTPGKKLRERREIAAKLLAMFPAS